MRFYDCINQSATEGKHYRSGLEWNHSQLIAGAAEGRSTGTNYSKHGSAEAWRGCALAGPAGDYSPSHFVQREKQIIGTHNNISPAGLLSTQTMCDSTIRTSDFS